ncbi:MAG: TIGR02452 family protein [Xenococcaceae cyanobacterium]
MSLKNVAKETLLILENGQYLTESGISVEFEHEQKEAVRGTRLYTPELLQSLLAQDNKRDVTQTIIEVTNETTQVAAQRLVQIEGCNDLVLLNYASARNPGGGFINGAKAQEEDLARCSGLYPCLMTQPAYYEANRNQSSLLYTDHIIYSPKVPFFRTQSRNLLESIFTASVITAPAPNAGQALRRDAEALPKIQTTLQLRAGYVLSVARANNHRSVLLGAWGCGVFRNDPKLVADIFGNWLMSPEFCGCFERVVFAIYEKSKTLAALSAFQTRFQ